MPFLANSTGWLLTEMGRQPWIVHPPVTWNADRSDVVVGRNWWVPAPVIVHHSGMYEKPFLEALAEIVP